MRRSAGMAPSRPGAFVHAYICTGHLLVGLLREEGSRPESWSRSTSRPSTFGAGRAARRLQQAAPCTTRAAHPWANKALELSLRESLSLGHHHIGLEHPAETDASDRWDHRRNPAQPDADAEKIRNEVIRTAIPTAPQPARVVGATPTIDLPWLGGLDRAVGQPAAEIRREARPAPPFFCWRSPAHCKTLTTQTLHTLAWTSKSEERGSSTVGASSSKRRSSSPGGSRSSIRKGAGDQVSRVHSTPPHDYATGNASSPSINARDHLNRSDTRQTPTPRHPHPARCPEARASWSPVQTVDETRAVTGCRVAPHRAYGAGRDLRGRGALRAAALAAWRCVAPSPSCRLPTAHPRWARCPAAKPGFRTNSLRIPIWSGTGGRASIQSLLWSPAYGRRVCSRRCRRLLRGQSPSGGCAHVRFRLPAPPR